MAKSKPASVQTQFHDSDALCRHVSQLGAGTCLLSFSCGKDSTAAWLQLRHHFNRIVPYYLYRVPGLQFVEDRLRYFEDFFGSRIIRLPHPSLYRMLNNLVFQPPEHRPIIQELNLPLFSYDEINSIIREDSGLPANTFCASGVRMCDSAARWANVKRQGPINHSRLAFYPVFDWRKDKLIQELTDSGVKMPIDYKLFGVSFDGINEQFLGPIREHYPADYQRILEFFPLAEAELARAAFREGRRYAA
jgi:hypothetical protein